MAIKSLFSYFPPPKFMTMPALGVDVSEDFIRYLGFDVKGDKRNLRYFGQKNLPVGTIVNGDVARPEILTQVLKEITNETGALFARVSLPEEKTYVFRTDLPHLAPEAIGSAVEFKIQENVPISPTEALFDYSIVKTEANRTDVSVTVVPQTLVSSYTDAFKAAGLMPLSFKVESQAVARAVIENGDMATALIIHSQEKKIGFYVVSSGVVQFASTIRVSPGTLVNDMSPVTDEVSKVTAYWKTYNIKKSNKSSDDAENVIARVILCGVGDRTAIIERELSRVPHVPVVLAGVWVNAFDIGHYIPELPMSEALVYVPAIGLALGPRVNSKKGSLQSHV